MLREPPESATLWLVFGNMNRATMNENETLPGDIDALRALILAERAAHAAVVTERNVIIAERDKLAARNERARIHHRRNPPRALRPQIRAHH